MTTDKAACEEVLRLLAAHLDGELDAPDRAQVERHLATCLSCCSRAEFEGLLKSRIAELGQAPVTHELSDRIKNLIRTFAVAEGE
jgi:anti-sigma factor (TIGR02949 family)